MYKSSEIKTVHLEITTKCNAACPMCLRTVQGGKVNPKMPLTELHLSDIKKIFPLAFIKQLNRIYMCGNYGDPAAAQDTLEIFEYFRNSNPNIKLDIFSNGSIRTPEWWGKLAKIVNHARFAIDGLAETNHLYRRGTSWNRIIENLKSFIDQGGHAEWDFIVFRHNEDELEKAQELAKKLRVTKFHIKKTGRFFSNIKSTGKEQQEVFNKDGEVEYCIEKPINPKFQNNALEKEQKLIEKFDDMKSYFDSTPVNCKVAKEKSLFISAEGLVFPCCWTGNQMYPWYFKDRGGEIWSHMKHYDFDKEKISAIDNPIAKIIDGPWIQFSFPNSWKKPCLEDGKLRTCAKTCGTDFDPFKDQFQ